MNTAIGTFGLICSSIKAGSLHLLALCALGSMPWILNNFIVEDELADGSLSFLGLDSGTELELLVSCEGC